MRQSHSFFIIALILVVIALVIFATILYQGAKIRQLPGESMEQAPAKYTKGGTAFLYPASWIVNDIPASGNLISVQLTDQENGIIFIVSSNTEFNDYSASGDLQYEKDIEVDGVSGSERLWQNNEVNTAVFRADNLSFGERYYRFEMFVTKLSKKTRAEKHWKDILASIRFDELEDGTEGGIQAVPQ